jgi:hypothetical protein
MERDHKMCVVPSCARLADDIVSTEPDAPGDVHHIIERELWSDGGYVPDNGVTVCNYHHRLAEQNIIPPQAFWRWLGIEEPPLPSGVEDMHVDKWGEPLEQPPWKEHRSKIKYPSTRHLPWSHERDTDDTAHQSVENFTGYPLIASVKMDGGNAMLVKDSENPVRARNGQHADKDHFDMCKQMYWENNLYEQIPEHLQIFGEWLYAKHSIHYGCDCDEECEDVGPALDDYFQVFGIYDTRYDLWLGMHDTLKWTHKLGLTMVPCATDDYFHMNDFERPDQFWEFYYELSQKVVEQGHEGIVVRSALPFHYDQIDQRLGKYVRPGHVKEGEKHWSKRPTVQNRLNEQ